jgi:ferritin
MEKAINDQINAELYSSYLYLSMAAHFESVNLPGFAKWMRVQAQEENGHAMKLFDYVVERGGRVTLAAIDAPPASWTSPLNAFEDVYAHEQKVTGLISGLMDLAIELKDHATSSFLKWFVDEQVEEEASADRVVQLLKMIGDAGHGIVMLDAQLGKRGE